jgi:hypothetical protein
VGDVAVGDGASELHLAACQMDADDVHPVHALRLRHGGEHRGGHLRRQGRTNLTVSSTVLSNNILGLLTTEAATAVGITQSTVVGNATSLFVASSTLETLGDDVVRGNTTNTTGIITPVGKTYRIVSASGRARARLPE